MILFLLQTIKHYEAYIIINFNFMPEFYLYF